MRRLHSAFGLPFAPRPHPSSAVATTAAAAKAEQQDAANHDKAAEEKVEDDNENGKGNGVKREKGGETAAATTSIKRQRATSDEERCGSGGSVTSDLSPKRMKIEQDQREEKEESPQLILDLDEAAALDFGATGDPSKPKFSGVIDLDDVD